MQKIDLHNNLLLAYTEREDGNMDHRFGRKRQVDKNREKVFESLDMDPKYVIEGQQIHDDLILPLYTENIKMWKGTNVTGVDGFITNRDAAAVMTRLADCVGVVLYDPENIAMGVFHVGWKGAVKNLHLTGLERMQKRYKSEPKKMLAWLSPSAKKCHYRSQDKPEQMDEAAWEPFIESKKNGYAVDLPGYITQSLKNEGMLIKNMVVDETCTVEAENLYSHQNAVQDKGPKGRFAVIAKIKKAKPQKKQEED